MLLKHNRISEEFRKIIPHLGYLSLKGLLKFQIGPVPGCEVMKFLRTEDLLGLSAVCKNLDSGFFANKPLGEGSSMLNGRSPRADNTGFSQSQQEPTES